MNIQDLPQVSAGDIRMMTEVVDDLCAGGTDVFLRNEQAWRKSSLAGFMRARRNSAPPAPATLDPAAIWARRNGRARR